MKARILLATLVVSQALLAGCGQAKDDDTTNPRPPAQSAVSETSASDQLGVIVDYSPTVSDVGALMYLTQHPRVDLLGVTLAGTGESRCDAAVSNTIALLELAGAADVPVACGPEEPVGHGNEWPSEWRDAADALAGVALPAGEAPDGETDAVELLTDLISQREEPVTVVALGPLTNLAVALEQEPALVNDIEMLYTMGGALDVEGNAPNGTAEWNYFVDPQAVAAVLDSGVPTTIVPLDATDDVPVTQAFFDRLTAGASTPAASAVQGLMAESHSYESDFFFWDEFTAALAVESVSTIADTSIAVETAGTDAGRITRDPEGARVRVAIAGDAARFEREFLETLTGAPVAPVVLDPEEAAYFTAMQTATQTFTEAFGSLYESPLAAELEPVFNADPATPLDAETEARVREFFTSFWTSAIDFASEYRDQIATAARARGHA